MVDYLARNLEVLAEAKSAVQPIILAKRPLGSGSKYNFVPCGTFESKSQGKIIHAGAKFPQLPLSKLDDVMKDFYTVLTNSAFIAEKYPELLPKIPLFCGMLVGSTGKPIATLTQDFSEGGIHKIQSYHEFGEGAANIPEGLTDLFESSNFGDINQLKFAIIYADGQRRIGDLDHVRPKEKYQQEWNVLRRRVMSGSHTLPFTRVPLEQLLPDEKERNYANIVLETCKDGPKSHDNVIHADPRYGIDNSVQINNVLFALVDALYLDCWRDEAHPCKDRVFALVD